MRGSIHQGGPDALMTGSTTLAARNRDGWPFRSVLDPAGAPQSPDRPLRARRKFPPPCVPARTPPKLLDFRINRPNTEMQSAAAQRYCWISFDLAVHASCTPWLSWKDDSLHSLHISISYPALSKDYITTCASGAHAKPAKIAHACTAFDFTVHTERTRNGDRRKTEIGKLAAELRGLTFFDDLPEVRCQLTIVTGKHLIQVPLGPDRRLQSPLFTLRGFGFVLLCFRFKISHEWCYSTQYTYNLR